MHTLVLGIGNTLLADEGIGIHIIQHLEKFHHDQPDTDYLDGGTLSFTLAGPIEDADHLIVVDAAELKSAPGTVRTFIGKDMDDFLGQNNKRSLHEVGLIDLLTIAQLTEKLPQKRALIGVQPEKIDWGDEPTQMVKDSIPEACARVLGLIQEWSA